MPVSPIAPGPPHPRRTLVRIVREGVRVLRAGYRAAPDGEAAQSASCLALVECRALGQRGGRSSVGPSIGVRIVAGFGAQVSPAETVGVGEPAGHVIGCGGV